MEIDSAGDTNEQPDSGMEIDSVGETNDQPDSGMEIDSAGEQLRHCPARTYQSSWEALHTDEATESSLVDMGPNKGNLMDLDAEFAKLEDDEEMVDVPEQAFSEMENQTHLAPSSTPPVSPAVIPEPQSSAQGSSSSQPHPMFVYRDPASVDMSSGDSRDGTVASVSQDDTELCDQMQSLAVTRTDSACVLEVTERLGGLGIDPAMAPAKVESPQVSSPVEASQSVQSANVVSANSAQAKKPGTVVVSNPKSSPVPSTQPSTTQPIQAGFPTVVAFAQSKQPGTFDISKPDSSSDPSTQASIAQPIPTATPTIITFATSRKPGTFVNSSKSSQTPSSQAPSGQPIQSVGPTTLALAPSKEPGTVLDSSKTSPTLSSQAPSGQPIQLVGATTMAFAPSKKPGTFLNSSKTSQAPSSQAATGQPIQPAGPIIMKLVPATKPGTFDVSAPEGNAAVSNPPSSNQPMQGVSSNLTFAPSQSPGSLGGGDFSGTFAAVAPAFSPSTNPYSAMKLNEPRHMATSQGLAPSQSPGSLEGGNFSGSLAPLAPAFSPSTCPYSTMKLDEPHQKAPSQALIASGPSVSMSNSSMYPQEADSALHLEDPQTAASKPMIAFGASDSMPTTDGNASPIAFVSSQGSVTSTASHARPQAGAKVSKAQPLVRVRKGFRERSKKSRQDIEACMGEVPEPYQVDVHRVLEAKVCDENPAPSSDIATSIPELANMGPGARVIPPPRRELHLTHEVERELVQYFKGLRAANRQVWLDLITAVLQSGRTPKEMFSDDCSKILDTEWVIDYERLDNIAREDTGGQDGFLTREKIHPAHRQFFDEAFEKVMSGGGPVFDKVVAKWALGGNSPGENKGLVMQCLERAGWTRADSKKTRFMNWSLDTSLAPPAIGKACLNHFKWASPRLLHAVSTERNALRLEVQVDA